MAHPPVQAHPFLHPLLKVHLPTYVPPVPQGPPEGHKAGEVTLWLDGDFLMTREEGRVKVLSHDSYASTSILFDEMINQFRKNRGHK